MTSKFGKTIRELRIERRLLQRQVAGYLDIDSPMLSKIESGERTAKKEHVKALAKTFKVSTHKLLTLWLADQVINMIQNEENALEAMCIVEQQLKHSKKT